MSKALRGVKLVIAISLILLLVSSASATVLIDSQDWTDVYSGMYQTYENWDRGEPYFVKNPSASNILSGGIFPVGNITVIESTEEPFSGNMESRLNSMPGEYNIHEVLEVGSANQELIPESQEDFIIVPRGYPEAAVVATPLARVTDSWVLIVDDENLEQVSSIAEEAQGNVIMIGSFVRDVENELEQNSDEQILTPNAHELSVEVAKRFEEEKSFDRVILSPGNSLSKTSFEEEIPILITYDRAPSPAVTEYMKNEGSSIGGALLESPQFSVVGNSLESELSRDIVIMVKFGQARGDQSSIYAPSLFPLPGENVDFVVESASYDPSSGQVLVTYRNPNEVDVYELSSFNLMEEGSSIASASDESPVLIAAEDTRTVSYGIDASSSSINDESVLEFSTTYGTNPDSLDKVLTNQGEFSQPYRMNLSTANISDNSNISLESVAYVENVERFKVVLKNEGPVDAHSAVTLRGVSVRGQDRSYASGTVEVPESESETVYIAANPALDRIDIDQNEELRAVVSYGKEEDLRLKEINREVEFRTAGGIPILGSFSSGTTAAAALALVLLLAVVVAEVRYEKVSEVVNR